MVTLYVTTIRHDLTHLNNVFRRLSDRFFSTRYYCVQNDRTLKRVPNVGKNTGRTACKKHFSGPLYVMKVFLNAKKYNLFMDKI